MLQWLFPMQAPPTTRTSWRDNEAWCVCCFRNAVKIDLPLRNCQCAASSFWCNVEAWRSFSNVRPYRVTNGQVKRSTPRRIPRQMADKEEEEQENDEEQEQKDLIDRQIRTHKALQHMEKELQLPNSTVMPVLLQLMKVRQSSQSESYI